MIRVCVIGSSHVGALKRAEDRFRSVYRAVDLEFFAVSNPIFQAGKVNDAGHFVPEYRNDADRDLGTQMNGSETADLTSYDHILVVGHRFDLDRLVEVLLDHDILEGERSGRTQLISDGFFNACALGQIGQYGAKIADQFRKDPRVTFTPAPYPSVAIDETAGHRRYARIMSNFMAHRDAPRLFDRWLKQVEAEVTGQGYGFLDQPDETVAGPSASHAKFAQRATDGAGDALGLVDHRHMNSEFGYRMLEAFATQKLDLAPEPA